MPGPHRGRGCCHCCCGRQSYSGPAEGNANGRGEEGKWIGEGHDIDMVKIDVKLLFFSFVTIQVSRCLQLDSFDTFMKDPFKIQDK